MCSCAHVHMASACVYICMNVCRAAAVFVLCNLEQPLCSGSIPHKQSQAALYVSDANYASAPKTGQGTASNSCQSARQCLVWHVSWDWSDFALCCLDSGMSCEGWIYSLEHITLVSLHQMINSKRERERQSNVLFSVTLSLLFQLEDQYHFIIIVVI